MMVCDVPSGFIRWGDHVRYLESQLEEWQCLCRQNEIRADVGERRIEALEALVRLMWDTHLRGATAWGWIAVIEEAEKLGIELSYERGTE